MTRHSLTPSQGWERGVLGGPRKKQASDWQTKLSFCIPVIYTARAESQAKARIRYTCTNRVLYGRVVHLKICVPNIITDANNPKLI